MTHNGIGARLATAAREPWGWLLSVFGGAVAWVLGVPIPMVIITVAVMLCTAVTVGTLTQSRPPVTPQQGLVHLLDGHVRSMRGLRTERLPAVVRAKADAALAAADAARPSVLRTVAAVDALDDAISATRKVSGRGDHATESIKNTITRLRSRRTALLETLTAAVDEVATVYTGLLEVSATARTIGVSLDDTDVSAVNDAVTLLQMTFADLEADAAQLTSDGLL